MFTIEARKPPPDQETLRLEVSPEDSVAAGAGDYSVVESRRIISKARAMEDFFSEKLACVDATLAAECDFFSVGTNDLTQYTLAVDRGNERVAKLYDPLHPAVLALIDRSARAAGRAGIPISVCGEMAGNPFAVPLLVGLGIEELSASAGAVPVIKEIVRSLDAGDVAEDARSALAAGSVEEVREIAAACLRRAEILDHPDVGPWLRDVLGD